MLRTNNYETRELLSYENHRITIDNAVNSADLDISSPDRIERTLPKLKLPPSFCTSLCVCISEVLAGSKSARHLASWAKPHILTRLSQSKLQGHTFGNRPQVLTTHVKRLNDRKAFSFCVIETSEKALTITVTLEQSHTKWLISDFWYF